MKWRLWFALLIPALLGAQREEGFVSLMPKEDVRELWIIEGTPAESWSVQNGVIACTGKPNGFLRSKKSYKNYLFRAEWRFQKEGWIGAPEKWPNAGFFIHAGEVTNTWPKSFEVQGHYGEAASLFGVRGGKIRGSKRGIIVPLKERPLLGDWDRLEVGSINGGVVVVLNGKVVNAGVGAEPSAGNVCLQSEGWPVFYRNVEIRELPE
jgi:hypothetical protein